MRRPWLSYWPPWQGHANPVALACTGQPRCMHVFAIAVNLSLPSLRM